MLVLLRLPRFHNSCIQVQCFCTMYTQNMGMHKVCTVNRCIYIVEIKTQQKPPYRWQHFEKTRVVINLWKRKILMLIPHFPRVRVFYRQIKSVLMYRAKFISVSAFLRGGEQAIHRRFCDPRLRSLSSSTEVLCSIATQRSSSKAAQLPANVGILSFPQGLNSLANINI